jgi:hypothetical protein
MNLFHSACFWFSLPLSIWIESRQIGLLLHWRALSPERPAIWGGPVDPRPKRLSLNPRI